MQTDLNMQNSMAVFISFYLDWKYPFGANLGQIYKIKIDSLLIVNQNCNFKFVTKTNLNMQDSVVLLTFSVFDCKRLSRGKFYPWNWSLVP